MPLVVLEFDKGRKTLNLTEKYKNKQDGKAMDDTKSSTTLVQSAVYACKRACNNTNLNKE